MKRVPLISTALLVALTFGLDAGAQRKSGKAKTAGKAPAAAKKEPAGDDAQKSELEEIVKLAPQERIERLRVFIKKSSPESPLTLRAREFLTSARAAYGDEKLRTNDRLAGAELFRAAVAEAPAAMSDKLFAEVVSQLPANLYVLGEREAARDLAFAVEEKAKGNARRLLMVAAFYLSTEQAEEAARVASAAVALEPDLAAAHQALGAAHRVSLRLEEAAAEFARALELDPKSSASRRSLADLRRATGKAEEALALYREQLAADPQDANARAGLVLSLFDAGKREEAERELDAALAERAGNLPLLVGAAYWYAANGAGARAVELAERAVALEPRYRWVWARVALARALLAQGRPLEAERALRPARELGSFPTLDYELASILAAAGLYEEAASELARSFTLRGGKIETNLAGRVRASAEDFDELLAPERRAGLFQFKGAGGVQQARLLKSLLAFHLAAGDGENFNERAAVEAARGFASGEDEMRSFRHMYAASRLLRRGVALDAVLERAEAAKGGVEAALALPVAPVALFAEELADVRARAISEGATTTVPNVPREMLSKIMRGRIEELAGWALYNQGQTAEAVVRLRRAVSVLPENTVWWRTAEWRLGAALEASGNSRDALSAYVKSYLLGPDPTRRAVIETLYKKLNNGSLKGLDQLLGAAPDTASLAQPAATPAATPEVAPSPEATATPTPESTPTPEPSATPTPEAATPTPEATPTPAPTPSTGERAEPTPTPSTPTAEATPTPSPTSTPTPEPSPSPSPEATATPAATPNATPEPTSTPTPEPSPAPSPTPTPESTPAPVDAQGAVPSSTPAPTPETASAPRPARARRGGGASACTVSLSESSLTIKKNGGAATVSVNFENFTGPAPPRVNPSTANWADIVVLAEPRAEADGNASRFTVSSTSTKTGAFAVNFNSPCGKQSLTVNVE